MWMISKKSRAAVWLNALSFLLGAESWAQVADWGETVSVACSENFKFVSRIYETLSRSVFEEGSPEFRNSGLLWKNSGHLLRTANKDCKQAVAPFINNLASAFYLTHYTIKPERETAALMPEEDILKAALIFLDEWRQLSRSEPTIRDSYGKELQSLFGRVWMRILGALDRLSSEMSSIGENSDLSSDLARSLKLVVLQVKAFSSYVPQIVGPTHQNVELTSLQANLSQLIASKSHLSYETAPEESLSLAKQFLVYFSALPNKRRLPEVKKFIGELALTRSALRFPLEDRAKRDFKKVVHLWSEVLPSEELAQTAIRQSIDHVTKIDHPENRTLVMEVASAHVQESFITSLVRALDQDSENTYHQGALVKYAPKVQIWNQVGRKLQSDLQEIDHQSREDWINTDIHFTKALRALSDLFGAMDSYPLSPETYYGLVANALDLFSERLKGFTQLGAFYSTVFLNQGTTALGSELETIWHVLRRLDDLSKSNLSYDLENRLKDIQNEDLRIFLTRLVGLSENNAGILQHINTFHLLSQAGPGSNEIRFSQIRSAQIPQPYQTYHRALQRALGTFQGMKASSSNDPNRVIEVVSGLKREVTRWTIETGKRLAHDIKEEEVNTLSYQKETLHQLQNLFQGRTENKKLDLQKQRLAQEAQRLYGEVSAIQSLIQHDRALEAMRAVQARDLMERNPWEKEGLYTTFSNQGFQISAADAPFIPDGYSTWSDSHLKWAELEIQDLAAQQLKFILAAGDWLEVSVTGKWNTGKSLGFENTESGPEGFAQVVNQGKLTTQTVDETESYVDHAFQEERNGLNENYSRQSGKRLEDSYNKNSEVSRFVNSTQSQQTQSSWSQQIAEFESQTKTHSEHTAKNESNTQIRESAQNQIESESTETTRLDINSNSFSNTQATYDNEDTTDRTDASISAGAYMRTYSRISAKAGFDFFGSGGGVEMGHENGIEARNTVSQNHSTSKSQGRRSESQRSQTRTTQDQTSRSKRSQIDKTQRAAQSLSNVKETGTRSDTSNTVGGDRRNTQEERQSTVKGMERGLSERDSKSRSQVQQEFSNEVNSRDISRTQARGRQQNHDHTLQKQVSLSKSLQLESSFERGLRSAHVPFPEFPAGALLVIEMPVGQTHLRHIRSVQVVTRDFKRIYSDFSMVYFVVNELPGGSDRSHLNLSYRVKRPKLVQARELMMQLERTLEEIKDYGRRVILTGNLSPSDTAYLQNLSQSLPSFGQEIEVESVEFLRTLYRTWISQEISQIDLKIQLIQKQNRIQELLRDFTEFDIDYESQKGKDLLNQQSWGVHLQLDPSDRLLAQTLGGIQFIQRDLSPLIQVAYPQLGQENPVSLKLRCESICNPLHKVSYDVSNLLENVTQSMDQISNVRGTQSRTIVKTFSREELRSSINSGSSVKNFSLWESLFSVLDGKPKVELKPAYISFEPEDLYENNNNGPDSDFLLEKGAVHTVVRNMAMIIHIDDSMVGGLLEYLTDLNRTARIAVVSEMKMPVSVTQMKVIQLPKAVAKRSIPIGFASQSDTAYGLWKKSMRDSEQVQDFAISPFSTFEVAFNHLSPSRNPALRALKTDFITGVSFVFETEYSLDGN
jgi:hypothetical protein